MHFNLQFKIIGIVIFMTFLLIVPLSIFYISDYKTVAEESYISEGKTIAYSLDASIKGKEELDDYSSLLTSINKQIWLNPNILEISFNLKDVDGMKTVASNNNEKINAVPDIENINAYNENIQIHKKVDYGNNQALRIISPIHLSGKIVGTYQIDLSLEEIEQKVNSKLKIIYILIFISVVFIFVLFILLRVIIIKPINKLKEGFNTLTKNDFTTNVKIKTKDEIGDLASSFNQMTKELKQSRKKIEDYSKNLEKKVKKRTQALYKKVTELRKSEKKFEDIALSSGDFIWEVDKNGKYTYASEGVKKILGYSPKEILGKSPFDFMPKKEAELIGAQFQTFVENKSAIVNLENWNISKNKKRILITTNAVPLLDRKKNLIGYRGVDKDITHRKAYENKILSMNKTLKVANIKLKDLDKEKDEFISVAAHELKTPLTSIKSFAQILQDKKIQRDKKDMKKSLDLINRNTDKLFNLVVDLVDSSRLKLGKLNLNIQKTNPRTVIRDVKDSMGIIISQKGIKPVFRVHKNINKVWSEPSRLQQVLRNLLINAVHFTENGGTISFECKNSGENVEFSVSDTGAGIPKQKQKNIFSRFYQVDKSVSRKSQGSGLGLSISKGLVEYMKGKMWFESIEGEGTTFYFTLKAIKNEQKKNK